MTDWITLENLADYMDADTLPLESSELAIAAACQSIRKYLDQEITYVEDDIELRNGRGKYRIRLRERPVREVTLVEVDGTELDSTLWHHRSGILERIDGFAFPRGIANIAITYSHGWDVEESSDADYLGIPADLKLVTLSAAARGVRSVGTDTGMESETIGQYSYKRGTNDAKASSGLDLTFAEMATLDRYAVRYVA
jgi:hypothetical protein